MAFPNHAHPTEVRIITKLIKRALKAGYLVSVFDGMEWALKFSNDFEAITAEVHATDVTELTIRHADKSKVGWIMLVHGNEDDVVSDWTDNAATNALVEGN